MRQFLLLALLVCCAAPLALARQGARTYTNEVTYVDRLEVNPHATELPTAVNPAAAKVAQESQQQEGVQSMVEQSAQQEPKSMRFFMEDEWESRSFMETESSAEMQAETEIHASEELNTDVVRQMALEIHDAAQSALQAQEEGALVALVEAESETEAEAEAESEMEAELDSLAEMESELARLTAAELAQEKADLLAEKADALAEQKDKQEEVLDKKQAKKDAKILATPTKQLAKKIAKKMAPKQKKAKKAANKKSVKSVQRKMQKAIKKAAKKAAKKQSKKTVVQLPSDLSREHANTLRVNMAASRTVAGALQELNGILAAKDDTIRSLVYNTTYLTVMSGKLANKIDEQARYIRALERKLSTSQRKNAQMLRHVSQSQSSASSIRAQLAAVEARLNQQDKAAVNLGKFLSRNRDRTPLPKVKDDLKVVRPRKHKGRKGRKGRKHARKARKLRTFGVPIQGTQTYASSSAPPFPHYRVSHPSFVVPSSPIPSATHVPLPASKTLASEYYSQTIPLAGAQAVYNPIANIPTIIVEAADDGQ